MWARIADLRPHAQTVPTDVERSWGLLDAMRTLMTTDATGMNGPPRALRQSAGEGSPVARPGLALRPRPSRSEVIRGLPERPLM